ncbi:hypothetical protein XELAEV_18018894mg [Xenopus laevis]|uniref:Uncharacterized protein n=1 Tax=Xenopus laevis TaxID=8355 RepID=A0A974DGJ1_XENLA|nr:hypothetical protein XELAEV_18018894mg [Xenopus laevis]
MSCPNCVCGLLFAITPQGWRLAKITPEGYPASSLGLGPVLPGFTDYMVYRLNVHFSASPADLGDSLFDIRAREFFPPVITQMCVTVIQQLINL